MVGSAEKDHVNRNRSYVGLISFVVLVILVIAGSRFLFREWKSRQASIGQRQPLPGLNYCAPEQNRPCFVSFNLDRDGEMLITLQTERSVPDFYLQIRHQDNSTTYQCRITGRFLTTVLCTGKTVPLGETLQFVLLSKADDSLLAEGQLSILGLALATPELASTPTSIPFWDRPPR